MALEPIFEVEFHEHSYGLRPHRSAHHAILRCQNLMQKKLAWVIEGDVKACFDEISHKSILKSLREKIMDNRFLDLARRCLKAGVMVDGVVQPTDRGVPQGDLRRAALHRDKFRCRCCAAEVTAEKAQVDHIEPVECFANFSLAHTLENLQTLCTECHARKTRRE